MHNRKFAVTGEDPGALCTGSYSGPRTRSQTRRVRLLSEKKGRMGENANSPELLKVTDIEDDDSAQEEDESGSDGSNLRGFIVDDSDVESVIGVSEEDGDDNASKDDTGKEPSDIDSELSEMLAKLRRGREHNLEWEYEADMLSEFGKDLSLCMRAVCAIHRRQISKEMSYLEGDVQGGKGFHKYDVDWGKRLGVFLTGGDSTGDVVKSVEELEQYDLKGPEVCEELAMRYSKQLFEIYQTKEDPLFP